MAAADLATMLDSLIVYANRLRRLVLYQGVPELRSNFPTEEQNVFEAAKFGSDYSAFYSQAILLLERLFPERLEEFKSYYDKKRPHNLKHYSPDMYGIKDFISGIEFVHVKTPIHELAMGCVQRQLEILIGVKSIVHDRVREIVSSVRMELSEAEANVARNLVKSGHYRAAGALLGVAMEAVLLEAVNRIGLPTKKNPTIAELNEALKASGQLETADWRRIQLFADVRNKCVHSKGEEPRKDELEEMERVFTLTQSRIV